LISLPQRSSVSTNIASSCSADHRLAKRGSVTLAEIAQERWAMWSSTVPSWQRLHQAFADSGLPPPKIAILTSSVSLRHDVVASSDLLGLNLQRVVRQAAPRYRLAELAVAGITLKLCTGVTYRKSAYLPPAAVRFIEIRKSTATEIAEET
jgi:DNA-binding transcriptional LysR family regulator